VATHLGIMNLGVEYQSSGYLIRPIDRLSLEVEDGELAVLLGPSGCGKTTLLSCLAGLLRPTSGAIEFDGTRVDLLRGGALTAYRRTTVGTVFQAFNLVASLSARENVMAPLLLSGTRGREARRRADALLARVGLEDRATHRPSALSGGQQQRVAIARALVHDPPLLLADEPTAHLDHIQVEGVIKLMRDLAVPGRVILISTHDDRVTNLADKVIEIVPRGADAGPEQRQVVLTPGQLLFHQGDRGDLVYVIEEGEIELFRVRGDRSEEPLRLVREDEYFGELAPLMNLPRSASARAVTHARVRGMSLASFRRSRPDALGRPAARHVSLAQPPGGGR
jgi:putative ABC transport system ATP-binding protein